MYEKTFAKINLFCFSGPYIAIGKKGGNIGPYPKPNTTFSGRIKKKQIISFQKPPTLSKYPM